MVTDSLSKIEQIHFKKDVSGLILYKDFINNILIINNKIKHTTKRIEMLK